MQEPVPKHIEKTPGTCGGRARIAGHRIRVQDIVIWHEQMRMSPDEIVHDFPQLTLADVYAALAYYHDHREEISADMQADEDLVQELRASGKAITIEELDSLNGPDDSVSS